MDNTTNNAAIGGDNQPADGGKTFTQEQLNQIIGERLSKERAKLEADLSKREQELQHKEFMLDAKVKLQEKGLPLDILDALNTSSPEAFDKSLGIMEQQLKKKNDDVPRGMGTGSEGNFPRRDYSSNNTDAIRVAMGLEKGD